jgi:hypothetical protein
MTTVGVCCKTGSGVFIKPNQFKEWGFLVAANYSYATNKTELLDLNSFKNFGITIGVGFWH